MRAQQPELCSVICCTSFGLWYCLESIIIVTILCFHMCEGMMKRLYVLIDAFHLHNHYVDFDKILKLSVGDIQKPLYVQCLMWCLSCEVTFVLPCIVLCHRLILFALAVVRYT